MSGALAEMWAILENLHRAELTVLERDRLSERFESLRVADQAAAQRMKDVLGRDNTSDAEVDSATMARGRASLAAEHVLEAIASTDAEITAAEEHLAAAADQTQRAEIAAQLEHQARAVEEAVKALEQSLD